MKISHTNPALFSHFTFGCSPNAKCFIQLVNSCLGKVSLSEKVQIAKHKYALFFIILFHMFRELCLASCENCWSKTK